MAWLGVSVVGSAQEVAYLRASGLRADARGTAAHLMLDLELRQLQVTGGLALPCCALSALQGAVPPHASPGWVGGRVLQALRWRAKQGRSKEVAAVHPAPHPSWRCPAALQLDNPSPWVALPVTLLTPAPISRLTSTVAAAVELQRRPAVVARLELWQRRPAGVLCVEEAELQLAPLAVFVEQRHALHLAEFLAHLGASFSAAVAAAAAAAPSVRRGRAGGTAAGTPAAAGVPGSAAGDADSSSHAGSEASLHVPAAGSATSAAAGGLGARGGVAAALRLPGLPPEVEALLSGGQGGAWLAPAEQKVYIDVLRIATLELTISFMPAPFENDPGAGGKPHAGTGTHGQCTGSQAVRCCSPLHLRAHKPPGWRSGPPCWASLLGAAAPITPASAAAVALLVKRWSRTPLCV